MWLNRFDDDLLVTADSLERPEYRRKTRVRGKARATHTFRAQNNRQVLACWLYFITYFLGPMSTIVSEVL